MTLNGALATMVTPAYVLLSKQFGISVDEVASLFGLCIEAYVHNSTMLLLQSQGPDQQLQHQQ